MKPLGVGFVALCVGAAACTRALGLGTDVIWSTGFESGDLSDWQAPPGGGGPIEDDAGATSSSVQATTEQAHTGSYSAKFSSVASDPTASPYTPGGGCLYKESEFPQQAYYSAFYFLPEFHQTPSAWSVMKLMDPVDDAGTGDAATVFSTNLGRALEARELFDLSLLSLPNGQLTLQLFDARHAYLVAPLPDPVAYVPIGRWFQIEAFYRDDPADGELGVWIDGTKVYDVVRPTGTSASVVFAVCSLVNDLSPSDAVLYVDDIAVSYRRVTPSGTL